MSSESSILFVYVGYMDQMICIAKIYHDIYLDFVE